MYDLDTVHMVPHPPIQAESAQLAKHFAATYALFRVRHVRILRSLADVAQFCNHLPMAMVLPPTIRPYWSQLTAEKAAAPAHRDWEWYADPFEAKKEVADRQKKKADKDSAATNGHANGQDSGRGTPVDPPMPSRRDGKRVDRAWENAPEVRMAPALREQVEATVKKVCGISGQQKLTDRTQMMQQFPDAVLEATRDTSTTISTAPSGTATPSLDFAALENQLKTLAFRPAHVQSAVSAIATAYGRLHSSSSATKDPLVLSLSILSPLEAAIEWLLLHVPEDDLPPRYRPSSTSADFITGASVKAGGKDALVKGWLVDRLVKQGGYPRKAVMTVLEGREVRESEALDILSRRLCGWEGEDGGWGVEAYRAFDGNEAGRADRDAAREEEIMALEAVLGDRYSRISSTEGVVDIEDMSTGDKIRLHVVFDDASPYPSPNYPYSPPSFYITSPTLPSYMRLHLLASMLRQFRDPERHDLASVLEAGAGGAVLIMVEHLEMILPDVIAEPPDVGEVTRYLVPKVEEAVPESAPKRTAAKKQIRHQPKWRAPSAEDERRVQEQYKAMTSRPGYAGMMAQRQKLPAWKEHGAITDALEQSRVLVVVGETGCGKSTQLPQFILDHEIAASRGAATNIIVTQPRRVAAIGVASRVAQERMEDIDKDVQTVGYSIRGERRASRDTRLTFCTTGIVLRRLGSGDPDLEGVSHIVVDEAHERGVDTDLLICLLRDLLERNKRIKVVLMSATINEQIFIKYFGGCPSLTIPGFTYPVSDHYLEDVIPLIHFSAQPARFGPRQTEEQKASIRADFEKLSLDPASQKTLEVLAASERIDYALVAAVVKHVTHTATANLGAILIFMPGLQEIRQCISELQATALGPVEILPLHANLSSAEQKQVFLSTGSKRKIVVATNVAETSITIPDVVYVVDGGRVKETQYDAESGMQRLVEAWTSRASGRQRRGRAGRTQAGHVSEEEECRRMG